MCSPRTLEPGTIARCGLVSGAPVTLSQEWSSVNSIRVTSAKPKKEISGELRLHVGLPAAQIGLGMIA